MTSKELETFCPTSRHEWRLWLKKNHILKQSVWLVCYKKKSNVPTISWSDAVDEALCFGWIDSIKKTLDHESSIQFFSKRKAKSTWSKINKQKIEQLIGNGLMVEAGYESIEIAKKNGSWTILDEVEELIIPEDLATAFHAKPEAKAFFFNLSKSAKKVLLQSLVLAKRQETRQKRIAEIVALPK